MEDDTREGVVVLEVADRSAAARFGVRRGDIVVAIVDNEFTLKTLDKERGQYILRPANPAYPVIRPQGSLEIFGVLVGLIRKYK